MNICRLELLTIWREKGRLVTRWSLYTLTWSTTSGATGAALPALPLCLCTCGSTICTAWRLGAGYTGGMDGGFDSGRILFINHHMYSYPEFVICCFFLQNAQGVGLKGWTDRVAKSDASIYRLSPLRSYSPMKSIFT